MSTVALLLALSAVTGFAFAASFSSWAIGISSTTLAVLSSALLHIQGIDTVPGIVIIVACLTLHQAAYLAGTWSDHAGLWGKQGDQKRNQRRHDNVGHEHRQQ
jgi:hypothetical protein